MSDPLDPRNVNARLYDQVANLLDALEASPMIPIKDRITALIAIGRIQTIFANLRLKGNPDDREAGSAVRKYATAFAPDAAGRRKSGRRRAAPAYIPDADLDDDTETDGAA